MTLTVILVAAVQGILALALLFGRRPHYALLPAWIGFALLMLLTVSPETLLPWVIGAFVGLGPVALVVWYVDRRMQKAARRRAPFLIEP